MSNEENITPALKQYYEIKAEYPDSILFFRMGDFYEMFSDDAIVASKLLGIQLTQRNKNSKNPVPLCGVPHHSYTPYLKKLISAGKKVAICEQLEDPKDAVGIVKRGVTKIVTASTNIDNLDDSEVANNFLITIYKKNDSYYLAIADVSTGEVYFKLSNEVNIFDDIARFTPKEIIANTDIELDEFNIAIKKINTNLHIAKEKVFNHYKTNNIKLITNDDNFIIALNMVLDYFDELIIKTELRFPILKNDDEFIYIDDIARKTLELTDDTTDSVSFLSSINRCKTAMGLRLLKSNIIAPIRNRSILNNRYDVIERLIHSDLTDTLLSLIDGIADIDRITTKLLSLTISPREMLALRGFLQKLPEINHIFKTITDGIFTDIKFDELSELYTVLNETLSDNQPVAIKDGFVIRIGYNKMLDELRDIKSSSDKKLDELLQKEKITSNLNLLRLGYNKIFGYYFEVSKGSVSKVPAHFERKQTLVNAERFYTAELKVLENAILSADDRIYETELSLYSNIKLLAKNDAQKIRTISDNIAKLDMLLSFATLAKERGYNRPKLTDGYTIDISGGKHPQLEIMLGSSFIENDFHLDEKCRLIILTGPNMAGKSTYLRTVALLVIMSHIGSFIPVASATIGDIDRIFTRIGASDNLQRGASTFMVEMIECGNILRNATERSLVILDEVGRGTSTFDGLSLATAIAEYLLNNIKAKTLFATHYHELTKVATHDNGANTLTVDVKEWNDEVIFLHKVKEGMADKSYGIYVAKLASLPLSVIKRATELLEGLESVKSDKISSHIASVGRQSNIVIDMIIDELDKLDIDNITPINALNILTELKKRCNDI